MEEKGGGSLLTAKVHAKGEEGRTVHNIRNPDLEGVVRWPLEDDIGIHYCISLQCVLVGNGGEKATNWKIDFNERL